MPIDINLLRTEKGGKPEEVKKSQKNRWAKEELVDEVIDLDEQWRKSNYKMETLKMEFGQTNKAISQRKKDSKGQDKCEDLVAKSKEQKVAIEAQEKESVELDKKRNAKLHLIGNVLGPDVPIFEDEDNNEVTRTWGEKPDLEVDGKTIGKLYHHQVMDLMDMFELERGQKVAGHRGYYLKGLGVMLN